jgi:protein-S-isoprenylcysteine O-methyltransferase Ste14
MTDTSTQKNSEAEQVVAGITTYAAAAMLWVSAVLTVLQGISALLYDKLVVVTTDYAYEFNTSTWGWIHIVVGILLAAVAFGLFWGATMGASGSHHHRVAFDRKHVHVVAAHTDLVDRDHCIGRLHHLGGSDVGEPSGSQ